MAATWLPTRPIDVGRGMKGERRELYMEWHELLGPILKRVLLQLLLVDTTATTLVFVGVCGKPDGTHLTAHD